MIAREKKYRYPGTRPFTEYDSDLFYGRNEDIEQLGKQIKLEQLIILFGKSGLGKSSLLNAGVLPQLKKSNKYLSLPVRIGMADDKTTPAQVLLNKLIQQVENKDYFRKKLGSKYDERLNQLKPEERLWLLCKNLQIQDKGKTLLLVFDQFEELFLFNKPVGIYFAELLAVLLFGEMPQSLQDLFYERLEEDKNSFSLEETDELFEKVKVKIIISIRSDRMSFLNSLKIHLPQILQKTYEVQPLHIEQARDAMLKPARADSNFISPKFEYGEVLESNIINFLSDNEKKQIETFQLQLICQYCENQIIKSAKLRNGQKLVKAGDIGELSTIFTRHYDNLISEISGTTQQLAARRLIEENMIIEGNRVPLPDKVITNKHKIDKKLLRKLVDSRLLRCEPNSTEGFSYEISHDTLIEPILSSFNVRKEIENNARAEHEQKEQLRIANEKAEKERIEREKERKRLFTVIFSVGVAAIISGAFAVFGFIKMREAQEEKKRSDILYIEAKIAIEKFEQADKKRKEIKINSLVQKANSYLSFDEKELAIKALKEALKVDSTNTKVQKQLQNIEK